MKYTLILLFLLFLIIPAFSQLTFSNESANFGKIEDLNIRNTEITLYNDSDSDLSVNITSLCACVTADYSNFILSAGTDKTIVITLDPADESGEIQKRLLFEIMHDNEIIQKAVFFVLADIKNVNIGPDTFTVTDYDPSKKDILFFYSENCGSCRKIIAYLQNEYNKSYNVKLYDIINDEKNNHYLNSLLSSLGTHGSEFPIVVYRKSVLQGEKEIMDKIDFVLKSDTDYISDTGTPVAITVFASLFFGLGDGINPCAFTTLIFLLSALAYIGKKKKEVLLTGIVFSLTVFISYFLVGLGVFQALSLLRDFRFISCFIVWFFVLAVIILTVISFIDIFHVKKSGKIILQLPKKIKQIIHTIIRKKIRSVLIIGSSIVLGFLVSIFELGCTGQFYFPYLSYLLSYSGSAKYILFLLIYNLAFVMPLFLVFILTYLGMTNDKLSGFFKDRLLLIKVLVFVIFAALLVLLIFTNLQCFVFIKS